MTFRLPVEHTLGFLSLKEGCTGSSESTQVEIPLCWKSHYMAYILNKLIAREYHDQYKKLDSGYIVQYKP